ncbi:MAG: LEA type 2 family protein [Acidobacteriota bacterium]
MKLLPRAKAAHLGALTLALLCTVGCSTLEPPDVTLVALGLTEITMLETTGEVSIRLTNPHPDPLEVDGAEFKLYLDGLRVGRVLIDEKATIPRLGTEVLDGKLFINNLTVVTRLNSILENERFSYRMNGRVFLAGDFGRRSVRLERRGTIDMNAESPEALESRPLE